MKVGRYLGKLFTLIKKYLGKGVALAMGRLVIWRSGEGVKFVFEVYGRKGWQMVFEGSGGLEELLRAIEVASNVRRLLVVVKSDVEE